MANDDSLDNLKPPAGVIIPPPGEIREAIEKTAGYVVRGGAGLEMRLRENHGANPKFSFVLTSADPYNAYYEWRKEEIRAGRGTAVAAGRGPGDAAAQAAAARAAREEEEQRRGPARPADFVFSARMPRMSQKDLEIVRLTALFVAKNGRQFTTQLAQREAGNAQFQFLVPNHTFHNFFQSTVDQYAALLREGTAREAEVRRSSSEPAHVLGRARQRAEYGRWQEAQRQRQEEQEEQKKLEFERVDWNDFVVVEAIVFDEADEAAQLPAPTTLNDLQYASLEEKKRMSVNADLRIEEAMPFEDTAYNAYPPAAYGPSEPGQAADQPNEEAAAAAAPAVSAAPAIRPKTEERPQERLQERPQEHPQQPPPPPTSTPGIKIKENYVPRAARNKPGGQLALCPNCKQQIPLSELEEHMRIELLDPRWKEQKAKAESRYATTNLSTADVASNLKRLASQRTDIFDSVTGQPLSEEEQARRKKAAVHSFDGNPEGNSQAHINHLQSVNVEEQIRAIHQKFAERR